MVQSVNDELNAFFYWAMGSEMEQKAVEDVFEQAPAKQS